MSEARRTRAGGRESRRAARKLAAQPTVPYLTRKLPPYEVLGEEALETIEDNAENILEEAGIDFRDDAEAPAIWKRMLTKSKWMLTESKWMLTESKWTLTELK